MMTISRAQMLAMSNAVKRQFDRNLALHLLRSRPSVMISEFNDAVTFVRCCIERALGYDIVSEAGLERYVTASWILGTYADDYDEVIFHILSNRQLAPFYRAMESLRLAQELAGRHHV
ncbi:hypothetical protein [Polyangium sp. 15x6]|uniref:hypothetical protein n=1 Tax=Polyangium sp. 15x6 TaxID=3042687 RepID=UPI00249B4ED5|nr:hypothetical protein [Polyangium sp. 15x6]MDI3290300.1 hypothetical protein [Polyangium sp. 15x6]